MYQNKETVVAFDPEDARRMEKWAKDHKFYLPNAAAHFSVYISNHLEELLDTMEEELWKPYK